MRQTRQNRPTKTTIKTRPATPTRCRAHAHVQRQGRAREIQGDRVLTQHQEAMDRIVSNWTPRYVAARREHQELVERINDTRPLWSEHREEQVTLIERPGNAQLGDIMH